MQRRDLFALPAALPAASAFAQLSASPRDEKYWDALRLQYPLRQGLVYCNAANVCPAPSPVLDLHAKLLRDFEADPSFQNRAKFGPLKEKTRAQAAAFFGAGNNEIAFTRNTSEASNIVVHGLDLSPGDEVVLIADNHPSNYDSWKNQAQRRKFSIVEVEATQRIGSPEELAAKVVKAFTPRTKVLALTHVTSTTGVLYPAAALAQAARQRNIWFHLDGAQSAGMIEVNLKNIGCDSYATSAHKWLMGPLEAGILFIREDRQSQVWPSIVSVGYSGETAQGARRFEAFGQRDDARLAALAGMFEFLTQVGMNHVEARVRQLAGHLMQRLAGGKVELRTNLSPQLSAGVVKADLPHVPDLRPLDARLYREQGMAFSVTASGPQRGIRVSPHIYNSLAQMDLVARALLQA
jgi:selenocysteine lyase/cysteine desulfurase